MSPLIAGLDFPTLGTISDNQQTIFLFIVLRLLPAGVYSLLFFLRFLTASVGTKKPYVPCTTSHSRCFQSSSDSYWTQKIASSIPITRSFTNLLIKPLIIVGRLMSRANS